MTTVDINTVAKTLISNGGFADFVEVLTNRAMENMEKKSLIREDGKVQEYDEVRLPHYRLNIYGSLLTDDSTVAVYLGTNHDNTAKFRIRSHINSSILEAAQLGAFDKYLSHPTFALPFVANL